MYLWDVATQRLERHFTDCDHKNPAIALNYSDDILAIGTGGQVHLYDLMSGEHLVILYVAGRIVTMDFYQYPDYREGAEGNIEQLVIATLGTVWTYWFSDPDEITQETVGMGEFFEVVSYQNISDMQPHPVDPLIIEFAVISSVTTPQIWYTLGLAPEPVALEQSEMMCPTVLDFNDNGKLLAIAGSGVSECIIELFYSWREIPYDENNPYGDRLTVLDEDGCHTDIVFSPSGLLLAAASTDGRILLWGVTR